MLLGVAYKKDIDDVRESPSLAIIDRLRAKGAEVSYHDPFVARLSFLDSLTDGYDKFLTSIDLTSETLRNSDCVVIVTDHSGIDYNRVIKHAKLVVDTRNALNSDHRKDSAARIIRL